MWLHIRPNLTDCLRTLNLNVLTGTYETVIIMYTIR